MGVVYEEIGLQTVAYIDSEYVVLATGCTIPFSYSPLIMNVGDSGKFYTITCSHSNVMILPQNDNFGEIFCSHCPLRVIIV